jgi:hypothetical protein
MKKIKRSTFAIAPLLLLYSLTASTQTLPPHEPFAFKLSEDKIQVDRSAEQSLTLTIEKAKSATKSKVVLKVSATLPAGMSVKFSTNDTVFYSSIITVVTTDQTPPGSYPLTITCTIGSKSKSTLLTVEVK